MLKMSVMQVILEPQAPVQPSGEVHAATQTQAVEPPTAADSIFVTQLQPLVAVELPVSDRGEGPASPAAIIPVHSEYAFAGARGFTDISTLLATHDQVGPSCCGCAFAQAVLAYPLPDIACSDRAMSSHTLVIVYQQNKASKC